MKKERITIVTQDHIDAWKKQYGDVRVIEIAEELMTLDPHLLVADLDDQPRATGYISPPDNKVLSFAMQKLPNMQDAGKVIIKNCWLGGDDRLLNDDSFANSAALQVIELIQIRQGRLKKA